jgi:hypothetical protein
MRYLRTLLTIGDVLAPMTRRPDGLHGLLPHAEVSIVTGKRSQPKGTGVRPSSGIAALGESGDPRGEVSQVMQTWPSHRGGGGVGSDGFLSPETLADLGHPTDRSSSQDLQSGISVTQHRK